MPKMLYFQKRPILLCSNSKIKEMRLMHEYDQIKNNYCKGFASDR